MSVGPMDESMLDPSLDSARSGGSEGYFDGTTMMEKSGSGSAIANGNGPASSPYPRYGGHHHPYRRPDGMNGMGQGQGQAVPAMGKGPSPPNADAKPIFTVPFPKGEHNGSNGLLAAPEDSAAQMERQLSSGAGQDMDGQTWQRW